MNRLIKGIRHYLGVMLLISVVLILSAPVAKSQVTPINLLSLTNLPAHVEGQGMSNITSQVIDLVPGKGIAMAALFAGTNSATTGMVTFKGAVSLDGVNWFTSPALELKVTGKGTSGAYGFTNFPATLVDNAAKFKLLQIANGDEATNTVFITNVWLSIAN